ncbi:hypothetical protein D9M68_969840 [compost metagenome]
MAAASSATITAAKATTRFSAMPFVLPAATATSAGPMGIMVATSPSMGATRLTMRCTSSCFNTCSSSPSSPRWAWRCQ